ncbi:hypothetical protein EDC96DRAFT_576064 [Choanephora cucurbitarum]|nr:hypothetical protein EDC96DRAFT_576064 [Choanephora cucurbitarum]
MSTVKISVAINKAQTPIEFQIMPEMLNWNTLIQLTQVSSFLASPLAYFKGMELKDFDHALEQLIKSHGRSKNPSDGELLSLPVPLGLSDTYRWGSFDSNFPEMAGQYRFHKQGPSSSPSHSSFGYFGPDFMDRPMFQGNSIPFSRSKPFHMGPPMFSYGNACHHYDFVSGKHHRHPYVSFSDDSSAESYEEAHGHLHGKSNKTHHYRHRQC